MLFVRQIAEFKLKISRFCGVRSKEALYKGELFLVCVPCPDSSLKTRLTAHKIYRI